MEEEEGRCLPPEIIIEILSRLPVKHLLRFRSVSKHFCDLIDSHHFMKKHLKYTTDNNTTDPNLKLIVKSGGDFAVYYIDYFEMNYDNNYIELYPMVVELHPPVMENPDDCYESLGSCNGLLCLPTCEERFIFWNPTTRKQWDLPPQPVIPRNDYVLMSSSFYGFGHASESDDYKMLILCECYDFNGGYLFTEVDVYSLASNSWRRVESFPDEIFICPMQNDNVLVNECFHWAVTIGTNDIYDKILSFEIGSERFQMVPSPEVENTGREMTILALGGWLCAFYEFADVRFDLWVMKEYGVKESWTKLFTIGHSEICDVPMDFVLKPINYFRDCDKLMFTLFLDRKDSILSYDLARKTVEEIVIDGMPYQFTVMAFSESLVNPKGRSLPQLPPEIIIEIFSRLPVKHLLRFRSVSKHFCALIDSHHFMKKHLKYTTDNNTTNPNLKLIVKSGGDADFAVYSIDYIELDYDNNHIELYPMVVELLPPVLEDSDDYYGILGSCNGLLCLATCEENYIFWNPTTRKQWDLPPQPVIPSQDYVFMYSYAYGFGHVSESDDYKMVILRICNDINWGYLFTEVDVYSLASNSWRRVESFPDEIFTCPMQNDNVLVNECFHWAAKIGTNDIYDKILSFDIRSESFQMVPSPEVEITEREMNILALGGWLCAFYEFADVRFDLWVMKEYGVKESWTKLFTIGYSEVCDIPMHFVLKPINYFKDCDKLLFTLFIDGKDSILSYDLVRKTFEEVVIDGMPYQFRVMAFSESLVNPKGRSLPQLPPEIIIEIFSRLPVKHLLRFRSVSKHFCALIDSHHFMKKHLKYTTDNTNFNLKLIVKSSSDAEFAVYFVDYFEMNCHNYIALYPMVVGLYPPVIENPDDYFGILGSCNGLLCLITCERSYIFWNPTTRKQWDLPPQPVILSKGSYTYGFGHASESDDYKMLILRECYDCNGGYLFPEVDVYSLASNSWRRVESYPDEVFTCQMQNDNVLVNECLHWAAKIGTDDIYDRILSFEIGSESFQMVPSPQVEITGHEMKILALGGWLCAFYMFIDVRFDLWVMKEYGVKESWTKLFTIGYSDVCDVPMHFVLKPINYFRDCDKLLLTLCLDGKDSILSHDLVRETVEEVVIDGMPYQYTVMAFSESLVNPTGGGFSDVGNQPTQARISKKKEKKKLRKKKGKKGHHRK